MTKSFDMVYNAKTRRPLGKSLYFVDVPWPRWINKVKVFFRQQKTRQAEEQKREQQPTEVDVIMTSNSQKGKPIVFKANIDDVIGGIE
jgi:hypothetical protein